MNPETSNSFFLPERRGVETGVEATGHRAATLPIPRPPLSPHEPFELCSAR